MTPLAGLQPRAGQVMMGAQTKERETSLAGAAKLAKAAAAAVAKQTKPVDRFGNVTHIGNGS